MPGFEMTAVSSVMVNGDSTGSAWSLRTVAVIFLAVITLTWAASWMLGFSGAVAVLTAAGFAAAVVGILKPSVGLLGVGVLCTLDSASSEFVYLPSSFLRWNTYNYWLMAVALLFAPLLLRLRDPHTRMLQAFLILTLVWLLPSRDIYVGLAQNIYVPAAFGLLAYVLRASGDADSWYWVGLTCGYLGATTGLFYELPGVEHTDANVWSWVPLTALIMICLAWPNTDRKWRQPVFAVLAAANGAWIFLSGSRGNMLVTLCCGIYLIVSVRGLGRRASYLLTIALIAVGVAALNPRAQEYAVGRIEYSFDPDRSVLDRTSGRSYLAKAAWLVFREHPLGVGTGSYNRTLADMGREAGIPVRLEGSRRPAHSAWLKVAAENGIPGLALLLAYVCSFAVAGWRSGVRELRALGFFVSAVFATAFVSTELQHTGLWLLAMSATVAVSYRGMGVGVAPARGSVEIQ